MSLKVKCKVHQELVILLPENDSEHIELVSQVTKLFTHLQDNPKCNFKEVKI